MPIWKFMIAFVFTSTLLYTHYTEKPSVIELVIKQTNPVHNIWTDNQMLDKLFIACHMMYRCLVLVTNMVAHMQLNGLYDHVTWLSNPG